MKTTLASAKPRTEDSFAISFAPLSIEEAYAKADDPGNGAVVMMSGMVRNQTDGKPVVSLEYQAYEPMALHVFYGIALKYPLWLVQSSTSHRCMR